MSYEKACKHKPHRLLMGYTFNPSGLSYAPPKEPRGSESKRRQDAEGYFRALAYTAADAMRRGEVTRRGALKWLLLRSPRWWRLETRNVLRART